MITAPIREIFHTNLGVKPEERVLVFTDKCTSEEKCGVELKERRAMLRDIAMMVCETGRVWTKEILYREFNSRKGHGAEPPESMWRTAFGERVINTLKEKRLLTSIIRKTIKEKKLEEAKKIIRTNSKDAVDAVIALSYYSTSHTRFRHLLTSCCGVRYASMPLFDIDMFEGPMSANWKDVEKRSRNIARALKSTLVYRITTPNGTTLTLSRKGRPVIMDTGNLRNKGAFGNLPAGEVFFAPFEGTTRGKLVLEWTPEGKLDDPIILTVRQGMVEKAEGNSPYAEILRKKLSERKENCNIAELGVGTNNMARRPDNILEAEKIAGTIHVALGDNSSFGGTVQTPFHQDFVFFKPTLTLLYSCGKKVILLKDGELQPYTIP